MVTKYGLWVQCDKCGQGAGDAGVPIDAPFEVKGTTEQDREATEWEAIDHARDNGFVGLDDGQLLCYLCAAPDENEDDDVDDGHGGCWQPHIGADGEYVDCDGRAI